MIVELLLLISTSQVCRVHTFKRQPSNPNANHGAVAILCPLVYDVLLSYSSSTPVQEQQQSYMVVSQCKFPPYLNYRTNEVGPYCIGGSSNRRTCRNCVHSHTIGRDPTCFRRVAHHGRSEKRKLLGSPDSKPDGIVVLQRQTVVAPLRSPTPSLTTAADRTFSRRVPRRLVMLLPLPEGRKLSARQPTPTATITKGRKRSLQSSRMWVWFAGSPKQVLHYLCLELKL